MSVAEAVPETGEQNAGPAREQARPAGRSERRGGAGRRFWLGLRPWLSLVAIVVVWQIADSLGWLNERILPGPSAVITAAGELIVDGRLADSIAASVPRAGLGILFGVASGVLLGFIAGYWRLGEDIVDRPMQVVRALPFTALTPLFILWFGIGELPKIMLVTVGVAVPLYINTYSGIRSVDRKLIEVAYVYDRRAWTIWRRVLFPGALPQILTGLRFGLGIGWIALIVAETVAASSGIGALMTTARQYSQTDVVIVCIVVYALLGVLTDLIVRWLEAYLLRWRSTIRG